jgi:isocitrate dehydrogenase
LTIVPQDPTVQSMSAPTPSSPSSPVPVTIARGDGIGPEIMDASLLVLREAGARLLLEEIEVGEKVYLGGVTSGIARESWESIRRTKVLYKAPITTPQGGGYKSLNVTMRKALGLFANVRPCVSYHPFVRTRHPKMDCVIVRENEEDLYAGVEHRQTQDVYQTLKLVSRPGTERIVRYAFEHARATGRKKVTALTKDNIMKLTDGLFHRVFDEVAKEYPELRTEHLIIDIGTARMADSPEIFDVVVTPNLYGDILSDVAAQVAGSVGLAGSANIGQHAAMFEAIHGSAPDIAGKGIANPSGLMMAGVMMLVHIGQPEVAERVHNAWLRTIEEGVHTADVYTEGKSKRRVGTAEFAREVIARLGEEPEQLAPARYAAGQGVRVPEAPPRSNEVKTRVGIDLFVEAVCSPEELAARLLPLAEGTPMALRMITNRGVKVWPDGLPETFCTDHWRCRFESERGAPVEQRHLAQVITRAIDAGLEVIKTENLCLFDGKPGYSLGQGQ